MKKILLLFAFALVSNFIQAQVTCASAIPYCGNTSAQGTSQTLIYQNATNVANQGDPACLGSTPNATWFYFKIDDSFPSSTGIIQFDLIQNTQFNAAGDPIGTPLDVDFAAWGPFDYIPGTPPSNSCSTLDNINCPACPNNTSNPGFYPAGNLVDCSYDAAPVETIHLNGVTNGKFYLVVVTNFSNQPGYIKLAVSPLLPTEQLPDPANQAYTDCDIVCGVSLGADQTECAGTPITLTTTFATTPLPGTATFEWSLNGVPQAAYNTPNNQQTIVVNQAGVWSVRATRPGGCDVATDSVVVDYVDSASGTNNPVPLNICVSPSAVPPFIFSPMPAGPFATINQNALMLGALPASDFTFTYYTTATDANNQTGVNTISLASQANYSINTTSKTIWVGIENNNTGCYLVKSFTLNVFSGGSGSFSYPSTSYCTNVTSAVPSANPPGMTPGGVYQLNAASPTGLVFTNTSTGEINPSLSAPGTYTIEYFVAGVGACAPYTSPSVSVTITTNPVLQINQPTAVCAPNTVDLTAPAVTAGSIGGGVLSYWTDSIATLPLANPSAVATSGIYYIKSTSGTCSDIKSVLVTIDTTPVLAITNPAAVCVPNTVDITLPAVTAGSTGGGVLTYWVDPAASATPIPDPTAIGTSGTYYIKSTVGNCTDIEPVVVTINPTPVLTITNPAAVCAPNTIDVTAAAVTAGSTGGGVLSYWVDATATTTPLATPSAVATSGTYYIKSTVGSCTDIEPVVVTINPTPVLTITNPAAACAPNTVNITVAAVTAGSTGGGVLTYWVDAAATTTPLATPSAVATSGTYYIKSTVGSCTDIEPVVVTINPTPVLTITNPAAVCAPNTIDITAAAVTAGSTGSGVLSYWVDAAATTTPLATPSAVATSGTYYIKSTIGSCTDIEPVVVTINPTPVLTITNPAAACAPNTVNITAAAVTAGSTGSGVLTYWVDAAATTTPLATPSAVATSGTYYIKSTIGSCTDIEPVVVTINPTPVLTITNPAAVCAPNTIDITAAAVTAGSTGSGVLSYWVDAAATTTPLATPSAVATSGTYYIKSTVGSCTDIEPVVVTINPTPVLTITNPAAACAPNTVNITAAAVTAGSTGSGVLTYWVDAAATTTPLATPSAVATSGTYYIKSTIGSCTDIEPVVVTINPTPVLTITNPAAVCAPNTINITAAAVTAGSTGGGVLTYWVDAAATATPLATPSAVATSGTYYIKSTVGSCTDIEPVVVTINPTPVLTITNPAAACAPNTVNITAAAVTAGSTGSGVLSYWVDAAATTTPLANPSTVSISGTYYIKSTIGSCTDIEPVVVTINPTPVLTITNPAAVCAPNTINITAAAVTAGSTGGGVLTYWVDAAATATPLATPSAVATSGTYYIKSTVGSCTDIEPVVVTINPTPVLTITNPAAACAPNTVNITAAAVTAGSTGSGVLSYWVDAAATTTPLANPSTVATSGTYYIKSTIGSCTDIEPVVVTINPTPVLTITNPAAVCAPNTIDITAAAVTAGSTGGGVLTYWVDAAATTTPLATPSAVATSGTYYIKSTVGSCTDIEPVVVTINPTPVLTITNPAAACTPNTVNITAAAVTAGSTGSGVLSYWVDAAATTTPLANPSTVSISGTYYIKSTIGSCTDIEPVVVTINPTPVLTITNPATVCAPNTIDITAAAVTAGSTGGGVLTYWVDATATTTPLASPSAVATSGTYYIKSTVGSCTDIEAVVVTINPIPHPTLTGGPVCINSLGQPISSHDFNAGLDDINYDFEWFTIVNGVATSIAGENQNTFSTMIPGTYGVIATNISLTPNCPSDRVDGVVTSLLAPQDYISVVTSNYFADVQTISINVTPAGVYEYQLDNGAFQSSNVFYNVGSGTHTVSVRNECGVLPSRTVEIVDYPRYFTPNSDGIHDTWNIPSISGQTNSTIRIFDRFGKLIKQIQPSGEGWNGTFNNQELPSTDYWFIVTYREDNIDKEFRSHFAMKR